MPLLRRSDLNPYFSKSTFSGESAPSTELDHETFDIFLSHSYQDRDLIFALKEYLEDKGLTVYVDWIEDRSLDREAVDAETAQLLRKRMQQCSSLVFATSSNSTESRWMPWECGYFDGIKGKVAILPITDEEQDSFEGQEYLGLYPYLDTTGNSIWVNKARSSDHREIQKWLKASGRW